MLPVGYETHCQSCHPLAFDERILEEAPHEDPEVVEAFVRTLFFEYAGDRPNELRRPQAPHPARQLSSLKKLVEEAPQDLPGWLQKEVDSALALLFEEKCQECHQMTGLEAPIPTVPSPAIPAIWFSHSRFQHDAHRMLNCLSCHPQVSRSTQTQEVLIPGRDLCLQCHNASVGAPTACATCHRYHDPFLEEQGPGVLTLEEVIGE